MLSMKNIALNKKRYQLISQQIDSTLGDMMIASALIFEASTPFVSLRSVLSYLDGMRHSRLYMINGIAMVLAFFSCRILIYPIFFKMYGKNNNGYIYRYLCLVNKKYLENTISLN